MNKLKSTLALLCGTAFLANQASAAYNSQFYTVYHLMQSGNRAGLIAAKRNGLNLNATDSSGQTALCYAVYQKDRNAYELLKSVGADTNPPCLKTMPASFKSAFFEPTESGWSGTVNTLGVVGVLGAGVAIAAASSGGGGSGGSGDGGSGGEGGGGGETPGIEGPVAEGNCPDGYSLVNGLCTNGTITVKSINPAPLNLDPVSFETQEYTKGGFLPQINASAAYARGYTGYVVSRDENGLLNNGGASPITDQKIRVAVYDNGVSDRNLFISSNLAPGLNLDYGPCKGSDTTNCYKYSESSTIPGGAADEHPMIFYGADGQPDTANSQIVKQADWDSYYAEYADNYNWDEMKYDTNPHITVTPTAAEEAMNASPESHGTHVAGIIGAPQIPGAEMHGVVPNVSIVPIIYDRWGKVVDDSIANDILSTGAKIVNMSFSFPASNDLNALQTQKLSDFLGESGKVGLDKLFADNVILVTAAGNNAYDESSIIAGIPSFLASANGLFVNVVAVNKDNTLATYSNKCGGTKDWCLAAPGGDYANDPNDMIYSTVVPTEKGDYGYMQGTSMAAPTVSGSLALLLSAFPHLTPQEAVQILFETADDLGAAGVDEIYGHGLVNLDKATAPSTEVQIATGTTTTAALVDVRSSRMMLPQSMGVNLADKLPQHIVMLDKYKRAFPLKTAALVNNDRENTTRLLEKDLRRFSARKQAKTVNVGNNFALSFSNRISDRRSDLMLGSLDMDFQVSDRQKLSFFYNEDTRYQKGDYFSKATSNPFLDMNNAYGISDNFRLNDNWGVETSFLAGENGFYDFDERSAALNDNRFNAFSAGVTYSPRADLDLVLKSGVLREQGSALGLRGTGGFGTSDTDTTFVGFEIAYRPTANLELKGTYFSGSSASGRRNDSMVSLSDIRSDSFGIDAGYKLDETAKLGLQISSPLMINRGSMSFDLPVARDATEDRIYREQFDISMRPEKREIDVGTYFTKDFEDDGWFQAEVTARLNPDHQDTDTDYRLMLGWGGSF